MVHGVYAVRSDLTVVLHVGAQDFILVDNLVVQEVVVQFLERILRLVVLLILFVSVADELGIVVDVVGGNAGHAVTVNALRSFLYILKGGYRAQTDLFFVVVRIRAAQLLLFHIQLFFRQYFLQLATPIHGVALVSALVELWLGLLAHIG